MSTKEELNVADLESNVVAEKVKAKKTKKEVTAEDIAYLEAGVAKIEELGILSPELSRFLPLVAMWHDADVTAPMKEDLKAAFATEDSDGITELKDFASEKMIQEIEELKQMDKVLSRLNLIRAFYQRRQSTASGKSKTRNSKKTKQVSIDGTFYDVNENFLATLVDMPRDEKVKAILGHEQTKPSEVVEAL